tara:strand:- start:275 stop:454 length:180 start_codon:yes stop_codon:yes gene_type:complete
MASNYGTTDKHAAAIKAKAGATRKGPGRKNLGTGRRKAGPGADIRSKTGSLKGPDKGTG